jgi:hypothetical protein
MMDKSKTPRHDCRSCRYLTFVPRGFGFAHHSRTIFCRAVPNPSDTIRHFCIGVGRGGGGGGGGGQRIFVRHAQQHFLESRAGRLPAAVAALHARAGALPQRGACGKWAQRHSDTLQVDRANTAHSDTLQVDRANTAHSDTLQVDRANTASSERPLRTKLMSRGVQMLY